jgi:anaerobic magnesium-protoporphyrin IX monomethyl ester cyclase
LFQNQRVAKLLLREGGRFSDENRFGVTALHGGGFVGKTASMKVVLNIVPPLGLAYLAAVLEESGYEVRIFDCSIGISLSQLMGHLKEYQPDVVGLTSTTPAFPDAQRTAESVRQILPQAVIVLGGAHVSAVPEDALSYDCFDVGVIAD